MSRSPMFASLSRAMRIALMAERERISTSEALERVAALESRRAFLKGLGGAAGAAAITAIAGAPRRALAAKPAGPSATIGVVGAGLAGLACAYELQKAGVNVTVHEATDRAGGRCYSLGGAFGGPVTFPGQVVERGGEFIDTLHKTMLGYAQEFNLAKEDVAKDPGEIFYHFDGVSYPESDVVDEYRDMVDAMQDDLNACSGVPTADLYNAADLDLDYTSLEEYLDTRGAGYVVKRAIKAAYVAEYGREIDEQSCLNFLLFIHADRRSKFTPFGVYSDERYHLIGGNQQVPQAIRSALTKPVQLGMRLLQVAKTPAGRIALTFQVGSQTAVVTYDAVVLAIPFTVLRDVALHPSLNVPAWKQSAIDLLGYGDNAKMMVGFNGRPWQAAGCNGTSYSNLAHHQTTWETNPTAANATRGVITDYSGGIRGATLNSNAVQAEANAFLADLEEVIPGTQAFASTIQNNKRRVHLEHWTSNPLTKGSYTCYLPGQFTTIADNEGKRIGNVHFAGEHANSFYEWQGFMEGAALSGVQAAAEILQDLKVGVLV